MKLNLNKKWIYNHLICLVAFFLISFQVNALIVNPSINLYSPDVDAADRFGTWVAINERFMVVGERLDDELAEDAGAVYIYELIDEQWVFREKLIADDGLAGDEFGRFIYLSGDQMVITASKFDGDGFSGAVYVYKYSGIEWVKEAKLLDESESYAGYFGSGLDIDENRVAVGAYLDNVNGGGSGSVTIYDKDENGWSFTQKIVPDDGEASDLFGLSISLNGDRMLVSARGDNGVGEDDGAAYYFELIEGQWEEVQQIRPSDIQIDDFFGMRVSMQGDVAAISSYFEDDVATDAGAVYIFEYDGAQWIEADKLTAFDGMEGDGFGVRVLLYDDKLLVGSNTSSNNVENAGGVYLFTNKTGTWELSYKVEKKYPGINDFVGYALDTNGEWIVMGVPFDDTGAEDAGAIMMLPKDLVFKNSFDALTVP